ncbi:hypothetical protein TNCT_437791 [Trichonephila clavata]|uniref:Uncharacterized protein n=1 Tax=Trichonephila clavata TaxID=2740835 RepID=A0A8X6LBH5_TRICU|nr:hypothetical protein TNCT_437791 [Trichonephila clavata]
MCLEKRKEETSADGKPFRPRQNKPRRDVITLRERELPGIINPNSENKNFYYRSGSYLSLSIDRARGKLLAA